MSQDPARGEWVPRWLAGVAIAAAVTGLAAHAYVGFRGAYLTFVSGIWLTLARDLAESGVLFRDLVSDLGYGGTRYFPLFFLMIGSLLKVGVSPVAAGFLAAGAGWALLCSGAYRVARVASAPPLSAALVAIAASTPYFALQGVFGIRADVMAAALNVWGLALLLPLWKTSFTGQSTRVWPSAVVFALAFATKVTALALPLSLIAVAVLSRRSRAAVRFGAVLLTCVSAVLLVTQAASGGRAFRVWAACLLAGSDSSGTLSTFLSGGFLTGLLNSNLIVVAGILAVAALVAGAMVRATESNGSLTASTMAAAVIWISATLALGLTLSSPGTIPANQVIEWLATSILIGAIVVGTRPGIRRVAGVALAALVIWMAAQNISRAIEMRDVVSKASLIERQKLVDRIKSFDAPIFVESALWPILAGREVVVPDPFAARVVMRARKDIEMLLVDEIARGKYAAIILEFDPESPEGRGVYEFSHFGRPLIASVRANYRLEPPTIANVFVFVRRAPPPKPPGG